MLLAAARVLLFRKSCPCCGGVMGLFVRPPPEHQPSKTMLSLQRRCLFFRTHALAAAALLFLLRAGPGGSKPTSCQEQKPSKSKMYKQNSKVSTGEAQNRPGASEPKMDRFLKKLHSKIRCLQTTLRDPKKAPPRTPW